MTKEEIVSLVKMLVEESFHKSFTTQRHEYGRDVTRNMVDGLYAVADGLNTVAESIRRVSK